MYGLLVVCAFRFCLVGCLGKFSPIISKSCLRKLNNRVLKGLLIRRNRTWVTRWKTWLVDVWGMKKRTGLIGYKFSIMKCSKMRISAKLIKLLVYLPISQYQGWDYRFIVRISAWIKCWNRCQILYSMHLILFSKDEIINILKAID